MLELRGGKFQEVSGSKNLIKHDIDTEKPINIQLFIEFCNTIKRNFFTHKKGEMSNKVK